MNGQFFMHFDSMPKGTAQQKGVYVRNGRPYFYTKDKIENARRLFMAELIPHKPKTPSNKPIKLTVILYFDVKNRSLWGKPKTTKPDTDNYLKLLKDCMTGLYFTDDALVTDEHIKKYYAEKATIFVSWEEVQEGEANE